MKKPLTAVVLLGALTLLSVLSYQSPLGFDSTKDASPQVPTAGARTDRIHTKPTNTSPVQAMRQAEAQEEALELLSIQPSALTLFAPQRGYFAPPQIDVNGHFTSSETGLLLDKSCDQRLHKPDGTRTIETQLMADYGVQARERVPVDVFFENLTQFFSDKGQFFQLTARVQTASRPPIYAFEFYRADDATMQASLTRLELPVPAPKFADAESVRLVIEQTLARYQAQGALPGARLMQIRVIGGDGEADQEIKYLNALPTQWAFASGVCQLEQQQTSALCRCLPDGVNQAMPNS